MHALAESRLDAADDYAARVTASFLAGAALGLGGGTRHLFS
jgi:hypothetical protein